MEYRHTSPTLLCKSLNHIIICFLKIKQNTRRFAKRQISWFKRDKNIQHVNSKDAFNEIIELLLSENIKNDPRKA